MQEASNAGGLLYGTEREELLLENITEKLPLQSLENGEKQEL